MFLKLSLRFVYDHMDSKGIHDDYVRDTRWPSWARAQMAIMLTTDWDSAGVAPLPLWLKKTTKRKKD